MNVSINNVAAITFGVTSLFVAMMILVEMVSFAHVYKNVRRFFFARIRYADGDSECEVLSSQDPYKIFNNVPFNNSFVRINPLAPYDASLLLDAESNFSFDGADVEVQIEEGGFVMVDKTSYRDSAPGKLVTFFPYTLDQDLKPNLVGTKTLDIRIIFNTRATK